MKHFLLFLSGICCLGSFAQTNVTSQYGKIIYLNRVNELQIQLKDVKCGQEVVKVRATDSVMLLELNPLGNCKYSLKPKNVEGFVTVEVYSKDATSGKLKLLIAKRFQVKKLESPRLLIDGKEYSGVYSISKESLLGMNSLSAALPSSSQIKESFVIEKFDVYARKDGTMFVVNCTGSQISEEVKNLIRELSKGSVLEFSGIIVSSSSGKQRIAPVSFKLE